MAQFIDNALVRRLRKAAIPYEIRDTRVTGFLLRVQPSGVKTFYVEYAHGKRIKLGRAWPARPALSPARARERAEQIRGDVAGGGDPVEVKRRANADTFGSFIDAPYAPWAAEHIRTADATVARLKASFAELLGKKLGDVTPWLVEKWRSARLKSGTKPSTLNRALDDLKSSLNKAVEWKLLEANPIASVKRLRVDAMRAPRFLSRDEEDRLRGALDDREERARAQRDSANQWRAERGYDLLPDLRARPFIDRLKPLTLVSLHTGMRRGEAFALTWGDVDLKGALVTIRGTTAKSGTTRHIPLNSEAAAVLEAWSKQSPKAGLVFPGSRRRKLNNVRRSWEGVLKAAKITGFRWHDLRHTFASNLVMAGENLNTVRELLGHSDYKMTLRYAHLAPDHKAAAVAKLVRP